MNNRSLINVALVVIVLAVVWKFVTFAFKWAMIAAVIYVVYVLFIAGSSKPKE
jgi:hypothetical protein